MNKKTVFLWAALAAFLAVSCASQDKAVPMAGQTAAASAEAKKTANKQKVLDWANRGLGEDASPAWLLPAIRGNWKVFKQDWEIGPDKVLKAGVARAPRLNAAQIIAEVQYAARLANQLKQSVLNKSAITLGDDAEFSVVQDAATKTNVTIAGQEPLADFWQLIETTDGNGKKVQTYNYYVVYSYDPEVWGKIVAKYLFDVVDRLPDQKTQKTIAAMFKEIDEETRYEREKSEAAFIAELRAQEEALSAPPASVSQQRAAYRSGDSAKVAAASVTQNDKDYIAALLALADSE